MTAKLNVVVIGDNALADVLRKLCSNAEGVNILDKLPGQTSLHVIVETTNDDLDRKRQNLIQAEAYGNSDTLILTTVLGITGTEAASWLRNPSKVVGFSAFSTLEKASLIEIAPALQTSETFLEQARVFFRLLQKETETVQDEVGLVYARILSMIINEAAFTLMEGTAAARDIDIAMQKGTNYPQGPLAWADEIGLDDVFAVLRGLHREIGEDRYRPAPLLRKLLYAKRLGKKAGAGFYSYTVEGEGT
jgi:3-hydroxybutyryl-CoA dehydrogenase